MPSFFYKFVIALCLSCLLQACSSSSNERKDNYADWSVEDFLSASKEEFDDENYKKTIEILEQLDSRYPFGKHSAQAQLDLINAYYKNSDSEAAEGSAERFIKTHPRHPKIDYAYYLKALINFNRGLGFIDRYVPSDRTQRDVLFTQNAYLNLEELLRRFPESEYISDVQQRMVFLKNALARHELHVMRFYMDREAYIAAANRANYIIQNYGNTPAVPYALQLQIKAYKILELPELADKSIKIYTHNFPNGPVLPEAAPSNVVIVPAIWNLLGFDD